MKKLLLVPALLFLSSIKSAYAVEGHGSHRYEKRSSSDSSFSKLLLQL